MPTFFIDSIAAAGVLPLVIFRRTRVDPALVRLSDAITVRPSRRTAACSRSGVTLVAICTTTSSWIRRVSVAGGISTTLRSRPGRICRPPAAAPAPGAPAGGCTGVLMAPWMLLTTGGVLSAASCVREVRPRMTCVCWAARDCRNSSSEVPEGGGRMPVLMKKHSASLQFPTIDGNAGGREAEVGSFDAMNGPVVLPGPPVALPEADELVMLPDGKLEAGIDPGAKLMKRALVPAKPPTVLKAPPAALPADEDESMLPKLAPTKPPTMSRVPVPVTFASGVVNEAAMVPRFTPANPPR